MLIKRILVLLLFVVTGFSVNAQDQWRIGTKAGGSSPSMIGNANAQFKLGYHAGITAELKIDDQHRFQPQLTYASWGSAFDIEELTADLNYGQLALMNRLELLNNSSVYVSFGPYMGYLVSKRLQKNNSDYSFAATNKIDAGLAFASGYELKWGEDHHLLMEIDYSLGLLPVFGNYDQTNEYNHAPGLSVIYLFAL